MPGEEYPRAQVYLRRNTPEDRLCLALLDYLKTQKASGQGVLRRVMDTGLKVLIARGEISEEIIEALGITDAEWRAIQFAAGLPAPIPSPAPVRSTAPTAQPRPPAPVEDEDEGGSELPALM